MDQLRRLREQFTPEQAEALMEAIEGRAVSQDYLDARLEAMEKRLILWAISLAGLIVTLTTLFERLIR
jgi:hypothetical protein